MSSNFQIRFKNRNGNLHIDPAGDFDGSSAWELIRLLEERYDGKGRVFIDTRNLRDICPFGCSVFQSHFFETRVPADRLFFKGEKGYKFAPNKSSVITMPKKHRAACSGNCSRCRCGGKRPLN
ncbi:MAG: peptidylprolyl isomerase [Thermodesulfobacteriota bacterium]